MKKYVFIGFLLCAVMGLMGCIVPVAFVAGTGAGVLVFDKRSMKTIVQDRDIANEALKRIDNDSQVKKETNISVSVFNHIMLLVGQAPTEELKNRVYNLASTVPNIKRVYNEIVVSPPLLGGDRAKDTWITTKVKGALVGTAGLNSSQIKVVTENRVVYLMGIVSRKQADLAGDAASRVTEVARVVKIFEYEQ